MSTQPDRKFVGNGWYAVPQVLGKDAASVTESGKPASEAKGVKFLRMENKAAVYAVGSGSYQFQSPL
jgi:alpha-L-rhamnosidase